MCQRRRLLTAADQLITIHKAFFATTQGVDHALAPGGESICLRAGEVVLFLRVGSQVEEVFFTGLRPPDVFLGTIAEPVIGACTAGVFAMQLLA